MSTQEEFFQATFAASNAIIQLIIILLVRDDHKLPADKVEESMKILSEIIADLHVVVDESEFSDEHVVKHVAHLSKLADNL